MNLSRTAKAELDSRLAFLLQARRTIDEEVTALRVLLRDTSRMPPSGGSVTTQPENNGESAPGFRDLIISALAKHPKGLPPKKVAAVLEAEGYINTGKTPVATKASNEMWRLWKLGKLSKHKGGVYFVPPQGGPG